MSASKLPNEVLMQIAEFVGRTTPGDIESFGKVSVRWNDASQPILREHRLLQKSYTTINVNHVQGISFLFEIAEKPWIALYPQSIEISCSGTWKKISLPRTTTQSYICNNIEIAWQNIARRRMQSLLRRTRHIPQVDESKWVVNLQQGDQDYIFALLLASLPNLKRLSIRLGEGKMPRLKETIRAKWSNAAERSPSGGLRVVKLAEKDDSRTCDLEMLALLAELPSIERLHASNMSGMFRDSLGSDWAKYPGFSQSLTHLCLETCGLSSASLEFALRRATNLQSFRYIHHRRAGSLVNVAHILEPAHQSLTELTISAGSGDSKYIGPLKSLSVLRHVTVDTDMIMLRGKIQKFVSLMPASIETPTIAGNNLTKDAENIFLAELFRIGYHYPKLKCIFAEDSWGRRDIGKDRLQFQREFHKQTTWQRRFS